MISTPRTGWRRARCSSAASAGGQLEQPSEVNSSTKTGDRSCALLSGEVRRKTSAKPKDRTMRVPPRKVFNADTPLGQGGYRPASLWTGEIRKHALLLSGRLERCPAPLWLAAQAAPSAPRNRQTQRACLGMRASGLAGWADDTERRRLA